MNIFMIMAAVVLLLGIFRGGNLPHNKQYILWSCIIMFVVLGFRDAYLIGNDSRSSYMVSFRDMADLSWQDVFNEYKWNKNGGWYFLVKLGSVVFHGDYQLFIIALSAIVMILFGRFIYRYSSSPIQSFVYYWGLWFYTFQFNALKQGLAMMILLLAFDAIIDKKLFRFLIWTAAAMLIHFPAIVFLPSYFIAQLNLRKGFIVLLALLILAVYLWRDQILNYMTEYYYEDKEFQGEDRFFTGKTIVMLSLILVAYFLRFPDKEDRIYSISLQLVAISAVLQFFSVYSNVFERLADYYFQFSVIFVPFIFDKRRIREQGKQKTDIGLIIDLAPYVLAVLCLYRFNDVVNRPTSYLLPYQFYFQSSREAQDLLQLCWPLL